MRSATESSLRHLTTPESASAGIRYICFPPAGGTAEMFQHLAAARSAVNMCAFQYPSRADRLAERMPGRLEELAQQCVDALAFPDKTGETDILIGFGTGALVALETAFRLQSKPTSRLTALIAVGAIPPQRYRKHVRLEPDVTVLRSLLQDDPQTLDNLQERIRADVRLIRQYNGPARHETPCPIAALAGEEDPRDVEDDTTGAWAVWSTHPFTSAVIRGNHSGLLMPDRVNEFWHRIDLMVDIHG